jgi:hypothetical protein
MDLNLAISIAGEPFFVNTGDDPCTYKHNFPDVECLMIKHSKNMQISRSVQMVRLGQAGVGVRKN